MRPDTASPRQACGEILFVVRRFPHRSQTFILNEFRALIAAGVDVRLLALRGVNSRLLQSWPEAAATMNRVIAPAKHARRRYTPIRIFADILRAVSGGTLRCAFRRELGFRAIATGTAIPVAAAFARIGRFQIIHYQSGGTARLCHSMRLPHHRDSAVFVSYRGKDLTTIPTQKIARKNEPVAASAARVLPVCGAFADRLIQYGGFSPSRVVVHYSGIDVSFFRLSDEEKAHRRADPAVQIYVAGRLTAKKGVLDSIEAFSRTHTALKDRNVRTDGPLRLVIAGDGPLATEARRLVEKLDISAFVRFAGSYNLPEHRRLLTSSHIFLSHNVTADNGDQEGIPNVIKEAMAAELPVVSTWHSGVPELVADGASGFLVKEHDVEATTDRLLRLIRDPGLRERMGREGLKIVETRFDITVTSSHLRELYRVYLSPSTENTL